MSDADKRERTVLGLVLMAFGLVVFGVLMVAAVTRIKTGHDVTWPFVAFTALPLAISLVGALVVWPDQVGPVLHDVLSKWTGGIA